MGRMRRCLPQMHEMPCTVQGGIPETAITVVRKSFDARKRLKWVYIVDVDAAALTAAGVRNPQGHPQLKERCCKRDQNQISSDHVSSSVSSATSVSNTRPGSTAVQARGCQQQRSRQHWGSMASGCAPQA
jgi:hypothetical protein